jgi:integrase
VQRAITDAYLRTLRPPPTGRLEIWDEKVPGLVLRVTASGTYSWSVRAHTQDGRNARPKLGEYPAMGLAEARRLASDTKADIRRGSDPVSERRTQRKARAERSALPTVADRLAEWQADKAADWSARTIQNYAQMVRYDILPRLGPVPLTETTRQDWTSLVTVKRRTAPGVASTLYLVCSAFLGHAEASGWIDTHPLPRKGLAALAPRPKSRQRVLTDAELLAVWQAAGTQPPKARAFARLLILTGCRVTEIADISTGEIDREAACWTLPAERAKNRHSITLPLHPLALAEIASVWPTRVGTNSRMLGNTPGSGRANISKLKATIDQVSGVTGWRWHDLRRTVRTGLTRLGVDRTHAEAALNHATTGLVQVYDRHDYAPEVIDALARWQAHVASLMSEAPAAEVLPLRYAQR